MTPDQIAAELQRLGMTNTHMAICQWDGKRFVHADTVQPDQCVLDILEQRKAQLDPVAIYDRQFLKDLGIRPL